MNEIAAKQSPLRVISVVTEGVETKTIRAMTIKGVGCIIQVSTLRRNANGGSTMSESLTWVPGIKTQKDTLTGERSLVALTA